VRCEGTHAKRTANQPDSGRPHVAFEETASSRWQMPAALRAMEMLCMPASESITWHTRARLHSHVGCILVPPFAAPRGETGLGSMLRVRVSTPSAPPQLSHCLSHGMVHRVGAVSQLSGPHAYRTWCCSEPHSSAMLVTRSGDNTRVSGGGRAAKSGS
jgi:hypothetical protein